MLFNSEAFLVFLPAVFLMFWALHRAPLWTQNLLTLVASYYFYARWDWRFLPLLMASSAVDYCVGLWLERAQDSRARKALLAASLTANVGFLAYFKYCGFFVEQFTTLLTSLGLRAHPATLNIILPAGISFYTFQTMNYAIDVYRREIKAARDPIAFFAFVSFWPHLVAGPIQRATHLLPQFYSKREFDVARAHDGARQMLWGFVKKVVVADNLAGPVAQAFGGYGALDSISCWVGAFCFAIQIYCDFSGYSDIAIGAARLFGFDLTRNFAFPYFAGNIAEFWRRWHISLSSWFRDYVYIPLGGSRGSPLRRGFNVMTTFTLSGLWHGANWTFVIWGALNGAYYLLWMATFGRRAKTGPGNAWAAGAGVLLTFWLTLIAWIFFRAESLKHALGYLGRAFALSDPVGPVVHLVPVLPMCLAFAMLLIEAVQSAKPHALEISALPAPARWAVYYVLVIAIYLLGNFQNVPFIYFQF